MTEEEDARRKALEEKYRSVKKKAEEGLKFGEDIIKDMSQIVDPTFRTLRTEQIAFLNLRAE